MKKAALLVAAISALANDPALFEARKARVRALLDQQDFSAALDSAQAINKDWPDDLAGYQLLAAAHLGLGNYDEAEKAIQWMLDLRIGRADSAGWLLVARFREVTGDIDGAIDAAGLAYSRLAPGMEREARTLLAYSGKLQLLAGRIDLADRALREAATGSATEPDVLRTLARLRLAQGRREAAARILRELTETAAHPGDLYLLAEATGRRDDFGAFERAARERIALPGNANRELALYLAGRGKRPAEALAMARREAARRRDVLTLDALAVALSANGKSAEARSVMRGVLAVGTRDPEILAHAARIGVKPK